MFDRDARERPPMILIANDQEWSARGLESILGPAGYAVVRAYNGRQALDLARTAQPDLIILDERMPDLRGSEVCQILRDDARFGAHIPLLLVTADSVDREQALAAYRAGAWDFVSEPMDAEALLLRIGTYVRAKREVDRVRDESLLDPTTGLYNVRGLVRRAREIGAEAYRSRGAFACVAIGLDAPEPAALQAVTGQWADEVAEHVGGILRQVSRASDALGRLGRSEFAVIAPATERAGAVRLAERLQRQVADAPLRVGPGEHAILLRAGYCAVDDYAASAIDAEEMLLRATVALRHVRTEGDPAIPIRSFQELPVKLAR
jgi:diguanylate cyclase (GGDEF)-like protein